MKFIKYIYGVFLGWRVKRSLKTVINYLDTPVVSDCNPKKNVQKFISTELLKNEHLHDAILSNPNLMLSILDIVDFSNVPRDYLEVFVHRILQDDVLTLNSVINNNLDSFISIVKDNEAVLDCFWNSLYLEFLNDENKCKAILKEKRIFESLLQSESLLLPILKSERIRQLLITKPEILQEWLSFSEYKDVAAHNPEFLEHWWRHLAPNVFSDEKYRKEVLQHPKIKEHLLKSENLLADIFNNNLDSFISIVKDNEAVLDCFWNSLYLEFLNDENKCKAILKEKRIFESLLQSESLLLPILKNKRIRQLLITKPEILQEWLSFSEYRDVAAHNPELLEQWWRHLAPYVFSNERYRKEILQHTKIKEHLLTSENLLTEVFKSEYVSRLFIKYPELFFGRVKDIKDDLFWNKFVTCLVLDSNSPTRNEHLYKLMSAISPLIELVDAGLTVTRDGLLAHLNSINNEKSTLTLENLFKSGEIYFNDYLLKSEDTRSLGILSREIFVNEEYFIDFSSEEIPYFIDCGVHVGSSLIYLKSRFPKAEILGFEPIDYLREKAIENLNKNNIKGVEILPYALSNEKCETSFYSVARDSMAGSLTKRRDGFGDELIEQKIKTTILSEYLNRPVDFLKMDIEGAECEVLKEAQLELKNVHRIFCEYHHDVELGNKPLIEILTLLESNNFNVHISKSLGYNLLTRKRPMKFVNTSYSLVIWAENREFKR
ncbi:FkbM family methyltransferase [Pseudoalteromonas sp. T1lg24]|uniref:FkbM family methyltransferase n=1 Tax=Pseudoalteromonas sp. T1lg24 TaxID=2077099 RepID=UPI000CF6C9D8|nr:FkbM family methyltransferase [Pseudoalteromonas sp. T1lg24]